jgi:2',3'-cyclic-nucleotide 2'-phosphodiesterase/3'-nucleotidase
VNEILRPRSTAPAVRPARLLVLLLALQALLMAGGCSTPRRGPVSLSILSTGDFHGALDESTNKDQESGRILGGGAVLASTVRQERQRNPDGTLLLDAGDIVQGSAVSNLTKGRASVDFFNTLGVDAAALGNHEFDWGVGNLGERMKEARFPFLAANIVEKATGKAPEWAKPYAIVERQGVRIALIGLATKTTAAETIPKNVEAYEFQDPVPVAKRLAAELVPSKADLAVLVCHFGVSEEDAYGTELKEIAAAHIPGIAAAVGGHTHEVHAEMLDGLPILQAGRSGMYLGRLDFVFDPASRSVSEPKVSLVPVFADAVTPDPAVAAKVEGYHSEVDSILGRPIGEVAVDLDQDPNRECRMGNLLMDVIRDTYKVEVALQNALGVRGGIAAGKVTYGDVYKALPFDNTVVLLSMTGAQIARLLKESDVESRLLYVSGVRFRKDESRPPGERIEIVSDLDPQRTYRVAVNNYMAQGGAGMASLLEIQGAEDTGVLLRDVLADYIQKQSQAGVPVKAEIDGRIEVKE